MPVARQALYIVRSTSGYSLDIHLMALTGMPSRPGALPGFKDLAASCSSAVVKGGPRAVVEFPLGTLRYFYYYLLLNN